MHRSNRDLFLAAAVTLLLAAGCAWAPSGEWPDGACEAHTTDQGEMIVCRLDPEGLDAPDLVAAADLPPEVGAEELEDYEELVIVDGVSLDPMYLGPRTARLSLPIPESLPIDDRIAGTPVRRDALCPDTWWSAGTGWQCRVTEAPAGDSVSAVDCVYVSCSAH